MDNIESIENIRSCVLFRCDKSGVVLDGDDTVAHLGLKILFSECLFPYKHLRFIFLLYMDMYLVGVCVCMQVAAWVCV